MRNRSDRNKIMTKFDAPKFVSSQPRYRVFLLGMRGAGKTIFLSSLHHQFLSTVFHIKPGSYAQEDALKKVFNHISGSDTEWPPGTQAVVEYEFQCRQVTVKGSQPLFRMVFSDYPGGSLDDQASLRDDVRTRIRNQTKRAQAVIALIDGQKVLQSILDPDFPIEKDINTICERLMDGVEKPVVFLVTKWDILRPHYSLRRVRDELFKVPAFRNFVETRRDIGFPIDLIPVSAVGFDFAEFDEAVNRMKKKVGARPRPYYVEIPLYLTVVDQYLKWRDGTKNFWARNTISENIKKILVQFWKNDKDFKIGFSFITFSLNQLLCSFKVFQKNVGDRITSLAQEADVNIQQTVADREATISVIRKQNESFLAKLRKDFPESDLTRDIPTQDNGLET